MTNIQKAMKYALIYGFVGAAALPLIHESYANIGKTFSLLLLTALVFAATIRLSLFSLKETLLGITVALAVSSVLGVSLYFIVHEWVVNFLEKNSHYFYLGISEHIRYYVFSAMIMLSSYVLCFVIFGFKKLINNQRKAKDYIDNAFDDVNSKDKL